MLRFDLGYGSRMRVAVVGHKQNEHPLSKHLPQVKFSQGFSQYLQAPKDKLLHSQGPQ